MLTDAPFGLKILTCESIRNTVISGELLAFIITGCVSYWDEQFKTTVFDIYGTIYGKTSTEMTKERINYGGWYAAKTGLLKNGSLIELPGEGRRKPFTTNLQQYFDSNENARNILKINWNVARDTVLWCVQYMV